jgi:hypothetical protein
VLQRTTFKKIKIYPTKLEKVFVNRVAKDLASSIYKVLQLIKILTQFKYEQSWRGCILVVEHMPYVLKALN